MFKNLRQNSCGIYSIVNKINGHQYIGSSVDVYKRWKDHRLRLNKRIHENKYLQRAWNKYGENGFEFALLLSCSKDERYKIEQLHIDVCSPEYNIAPMAVGGGLTGRKATEEAKKNMSLARIGMKHSLEECRKISIANKGRKMLPEQIQKVWINRRLAQSKRENEKLWMTWEVAIKNEYCD